MTNYQDLCVYCCEKLKETSDHVPPKSFFPKPRPSDLITVPSCLRCNHDVGEDEEFFLATFMFTQGGVSEAGNKLWAEKLHRMYEKNLGLKRKIAQALSYADILTPAGLFLGRKMAIQTDEKRFDKVVHKIVRGLYYFEYNEPLSITTEILSLFLKQEQHFEAARQPVHQLKNGSRGWEGIFEYKFNRLGDSKEDSMWLIRFFDFAIFWIITGNENDLTKPFNSDAGMESGC